jgi:hypothetical protein
MPFCLFTNFNRKLHDKYLEAADFLCTFALSKGDRFFCGPTRQKIFHSARGIFFSLAAKMRSDPETKKLINIIY